MVHAVVTTTVSPSSPPRSPEAWTQDSPKPLLYDLFPVLEWFSGDPFHSEPSTKLTQVLPSMHSNPSLYPFHQGCPWRMAATDWTSESKMVAVATQTRLELYQPDGSESEWTLVASERIPSDLFPSWRHLGWSADGQWLSLCSSQGNVSLYSAQAQLLHTFDLFTSAEWDPVRHWHMEKNLAVYHVHYATVRGRVGLLELHLPESDAVVIKPLARFDVSPWFPWISTCQWLPNHAALLLTGPRDDLLHPFLVLFIRHSIQLHAHFPALPPRPPLSRWTWLASYVKRPRNPLEQTTLHVSLAPNQKRLLAQVGDGTLHVFDTATLQRLETYSKDVVCQWNQCKEFRYTSWWSDTALVFVNGRGQWHLYSYPNFHRLLADAETFALPFEVTFLGSNHALILSCQTQHKPHPRLVPPQQGLLTRTLTSLTNTLLWHFDDEHTALVFPTSPSETHVQLWKWLPQQPDTLLVRYLHANQFDTALTLAHQYGLSTDLVYQTQWQTQLDADQDVHSELLDQIQNKAWVLETCLQQQPRSMDLAFQLLDYGLALTQKLYDPKASATYPFLKYRCELLQLQQRYQVFQLLLSQNHVAMPSLDTFRKTNMIVSACHLAHGVHLDALALLFDAKPEWFCPFRCVILNHIPTYVDPDLYTALLPHPNHPEPKHDVTPEEAKLIEFQMDVDAYPTILHPEQWYVDRAIAIERETGNVQSSLKLLQAGERLALGTFATWLSPMRMYAAFLYDLIPMQHTLSKHLDFTSFRALSFDEKLHHVLDFFPTPTCPAALLADGILPLFQSDADWRHMFTLLQAWAPTMPFAHLVSFLCTVAPTISSELFVEQTLVFLYALSFDFTLDLYQTLQPLVDRLLSVPVAKDSDFSSKLELFETHTLVLKILLDKDVSGMNYITIQSLDPLQFLHLWLSRISSSGSEVYALFIELLNSPFMDAKHQSKYFALVYNRLLLCEAFDEARLFAPLLEPSDLVQWTLEWMQPYLAQGAFEVCLQGLQVLPLPEFADHERRIRVLQECHQAHLRPPVTASNLELLRFAIPHVSEPHARQMGQLLGFSALTLDIEIAMHTCHQVRSMELCQTLMLRGPDMAEPLLNILEHRSPRTATLLECLPFCLKHVPPAALPRVLRLAPVPAEHVPFAMTRKQLEPFFDPDTSWNTLESWLHAETCLSNDPLTLFHGTADLHTALVALPLCDPALVDVQFQALQLYSMVRALLPSTTAHSALQGLVQLQQEGLCSPPLIRLVKEIEDLEQQSIQLILAQIPQLDLTRFLQDTTYQQEVIHSLMVDHQLDLAQRVLPYTSLPNKSTTYLLERWLNAHAVDSPLEIPFLVDSWCDTILQKESREPIVQTLVNTFENDSAKHNQSHFYRFLAKFDSSDLAMHYLQRADLVDQRLDPNWSCQFIITQMMQGNRDYFAALFNTYFHHHDPLLSIPLSPSVMNFFHQLASLEPIPVLDRRSVVSIRLPFPAFQSVWMSCALLRAIKSRTAPVDQIFPLLAHALPLLDPTDTPWVASELFPFIKRHCHFTFHTFYAQLVPHLSLPLFQPIVDALEIFQLLKCHWIRVSIFQYPLAAFLEHAVQQPCPVSTLDVLHRVVTWDTVSFDDAVYASLAPCSMSTLLSLHPLWKGSKYEGYLWDRWVQLDPPLSQLPEMDSVTHFKWHARKSFPNVFRTPIPFDELHTHWLQQGHQDHALRTHTVFSMRPAQQYLALWQRELAWFQTQPCHFLYNALIQLEPPLDEQTEWALFDHLVSPPHIFMFCLCSHHPDLLFFAKAMLTRLPPEDSSSTVSTTPVYPLSRVRPFLQLHPELGKSETKVSPDFFYTHALGLHPSLWASWIADRVTWKHHSLQPPPLHSAKSPWKFELTEQEEWAILFRRFQRPA